MTTVRFRFGRLILLMGFIAVPGMLQPLAAGQRMEPDGFGKAQFGMRLSQVQSLYPELQPISAPAPAAGHEEPPLRLHVNRLENQTLGPLKCQIDMRFVATKQQPDPELYEIHFLCPNKTAVLEYLQDQYGGPTNTTRAGLLWTGVKVDITEVPASGAFLFGDKQRSTQVQLTLLHYLMSHHVQMVPVGNERPAAAAPPSN